MRSVYKGIVMSFLAFATVLSGAASALERSRFPLGPDPQLTPGSYCEHPDSYRYPEHIPYCERNVNRNTKQRVIQMYNEQLGFDIRPGERSQYKIDHLIPLCAGGSNNINNLWPQHQSVYSLTDPLEPLVCEKMSKGRVSQKRAIELLMHAKLHLEDVEKVMAELEAL